MLVAACSGGEEERGIVLSDDLGPFATDVIDLGEESWSVAVADTSAERRQGLRGVRDLGDLDGMLFVFETTTSATFTMRDTLMPIDIAFFDSAGDLVDRLEMVPCAAEPCPSYQASGPFRYALETEAGGFDGLGELMLSP
jgi:uncharacterized membrane protein (UPF0127 family)